MSYSRFLSSDVYMALDGSSGAIWCYSCSMNGLDDKPFTKRTDDIEQLKQHMAQGDISAGIAIPMLQNENQQWGDKERITS